MTLLNSGQVFYILISFRNIWQHLNMDGLKTSSFCLKILTFHREGKKIYSYILMETFTFLFLPLNCLTGAQISIPIKPFIVLVISSRLSVLFA